jgi:hypothetical protein
MTVSFMVMIMLEGFMYSWYGKGLLSRPEAYWEIELLLMFEQIITAVSDIIGSNRKGNLLWRRGLVSPGREGDCESIVKTSISIG